MFRLSHVCLDVFLLGWGHGHLETYLSVLAKHERSAKCTGSRLRVHREAAHEQSSYLISWVGFTYTSVFFPPSGNR